MLAMLTVPIVLTTSAEDYALERCLRMIRHCLDLEEKRRLCLAMAMRQERKARIADICHRIWLCFARP